MFFLHGTRVALESPFGSRSWGGRGYKNARNARTICEKPEAARVRTARVWRMSRFSGLHRSGSIFYADQYHRGVTRGDFVKAVVVRSLSGSVLSVLLAISVLQAPVPAAADTGCATPVAPPIEGGIYQVSTQAHLMWIKEGNTLANVARLGFSYVMTQDIDMTGCTWSSGIADAAGDGNCTGGAGCFSGIFDGGGFNIENFTLTASLTGSTSGWIGFFGNVVGGTVRNLTVIAAITVTSTSDGTVYAGPVVGLTRGASTLQNLSGRGSVTVTGKEVLYAGGAIGYCLNNTGTLSNISSSTNVSATTSDWVYVGGICGYQLASLVGAHSAGTLSGQGEVIHIGGISSFVGNLGGVSGATSTASITSALTSGDTAYIGGIAGQYTDSSGPLRARATGSITVTGTGGGGQFGGLVGLSTAPIVDSVATGSVSVTGTTGQVYAAGLVGGQNRLISRSYATGAVSVTQSGSNSVYAGGLSSFSFSTDTTNGVESSYATGDVTVSSSATSPIYVGGLTGFQSNPVADVFASGSVSANATSPDASADVHAGGLSGHSSRNNITNAYALGNVVASTNGGAAAGGGIAGTTDGTSTFTETYAAGSVTVTTSGLTAVAAGTVPTTTTLVRSFCVSSVAATCGLSTTPSDQGTITTIAELKTFKLFDDAGWSITEGYSSSTSWGICSRYNQGFAFLTSVQTANPCVAPDPAQVPPSWHQSMGRNSSDADCPSGWNPSWAQWPNGGTGGFVCNREIYYDIDTGGWLTRSAFLRT